MGNALNGTCLIPWMDASMGPMCPTCIFKPLAEQVGYITKFWCVNLSFFVFLTGESVCIMS